MYYLIDSFYLFFFLKKKIYSFPFLHKYTMATFKETSPLELNPKETSTKLKVSTNKVSNVLSAARMFETMAAPSIKDKLAKFENKGPKNNEVSSNFERKNIVKGFETNLDKKNNNSLS